MIPLSSLTKYKSTNITGISKYNNNFFYIVLTVNSNFKRVTELLMTDGFRKETALRSLKVKKRIQNFLLTIFSSKA